MELIFQLTFTKWHTSTKRKLSTLQTLIQQTVWPVSYGLKMKEDPRTLLTW